MFQPCIFCGYWFYTKFICLVKRTYMCIQTVWYTIYPLVSWSDLSFGKLTSNIIDTHKHRNKTTKQYRSKVADTSHLQWILPIFPRDKGFFLFLISTFLHQKLRKIMPALFWPLSNDRRLLYFIIFWWHFPTNNDNNLKWLVVYM